ncbi:hypothetical protein PIIN_05097 [Serendipita indica DSM 11827]|uniref:F-box domain-containing protein n=1 Tax=Serendipita indica (strain DSM 11827) TaxID=1109443 RepID=G4TIL8_SERID|nr:hypothetical protein PIIN_05097 [Serendipita indica DSM 11827]
MHDITTLKFKMLRHLEPLTLPKLRHLCVWTTSDLLDTFTSWLSNIGHQLSTLWWGATPGIVANITLEPTVWEICPQITSLALPNVVPWTRPPQGHPIATLSVHLEVIRPSEWTRLVCPVCQRLHIRWAIQPSFDKIMESGVSTLVLEWEWETWIPHWLDGDKFATYCVVKLFQMHGFRLLDFYWRTLDEYIVQRLEIAKGRGKGIGQNYNPLFAWFETPVIL